MEIEMNPDTEKVELAPKKRYEPPVLSWLGRLKDLTRNLGNKLTKDNQNGHFHATAG